MINKEIEMRKSEAFYRYYELTTEYGPLYIYEKYKMDPNKANKFNQEIPVTREFFTNEEGIRSYCTLNFMNQTAKFVTTEMLMNGLPLENYMEELQPYEFLMKVSPFIETDEQKLEKAQEVYQIFEWKSKSIQNIRILKNQPKKSQRSRNEYAKSLLKKHMI